MRRILYEKKEEIKLFCTYNRSENVYYGKFISLFFQNKNFIMMYLTESSVYLCCIKSMGNITIVNIKVNIKEEKYVTIIIKR